MLEQVQPLVSGILTVEARVRLRALGASGAGCRLASFLPCLWQVASPGSSKALAGQGELTRKVEELQQKLDEEVKVR